MDTPSVPDPGEVRSEQGRSERLDPAALEKSSQSFTGSFWVAAALTALFGYNTIAALITTIKEPTMFLAGLTMVLAGLTILLARATYKRWRSAGTENPDHAPTSST